MDDDWQSVTSARSASLGIESLPDSRTATPAASRPVSPTAPRSLDSRPATPAASRPVSPPDPRPPASAPDDFVWWVAQEDALTRQIKKLKGTIADAQRAVDALCAQRAALRARRAARRAAHSPVITDAQRAATEAVVRACAAPGLGADDAIQIIERARAGAPGAPLEAVVNTFHVARAIATRKNVWYADFVKSAHQLLADAVVGEFDASLWPWLKPDGYVETLARLGAPVSGAFLAKHVLGTDDATLARLLARAARDGAVMRERRAKWCADTPARHAREVANLRRRQAEYLGGPGLNDDPAKTRRMMEHERAEMARRHAHDLALIAAEAARAP